jgi:6-phosphofructokinase 1
MPRFVPVANLGPGRFDSPLPLAGGPGEGHGRFVSDEVRVRAEVVVPADEAGELLFERAGPRQRLFFDPAAATAAIVTCGGLCPGLNNVIRSAFLELHHRYRVPRVLGIRNGFLGLTEAGPPPLTLTPEIVDGIHEEGGTLLGSSRGPQPLEAMAAFLERHRVDVLLCVGGDGTQRGAHAIYEELARRGRPTAVVGVPKTIDNDLDYCDRTFGLVTAVDKCREVLDAAHNEARGAVRGIGLVKVMGRHAGFIACLSAVASQEVNFVLVPECPFRLDGLGGLLASLERRMDDRRHAVIVVAEGAGQDLLDGSEERDASGNKRLADIGPFLKDRIAAHFKQLGRPVDIKYIDPSYFIRSVPANTDDALLCDQLARGAVHAGMAGKTDALICYKNGKFIHVPIPMAVGRSRTVDLDGDLWASVLACTGQPARFA